MKNLKTGFLILISVILLNSCSTSEEDSPQIPTVSTVGINDVANTTAVAGGNITDQGDANVTARGVCWGTTENPTTSNNKTTDGSGTGTFTSNLSGLTAGTTYYYRAYATNSGGTAYGNQLSFTTTNIPEAGSTREFTMDITHDRDGSSYALFSDGSRTCMYVDGIEFDMDPYAVSYTVLFYDMVRSRDGEPDTYPEDASRTFTADGGTEILNSTINNIEYHNWYYVGVASAVTRITPQEKFWVTVSWCTDTACIDGCYWVDGQAKVTVQY